MPTSAGHFRKAIRLLKVTGQPIVRAMAETKRAFPLSFEARRSIVGLTEEGLRRKTRLGLFNLYQSKRYLESFLPEGAMTYGLDGKPVAPVSDLERAWAEKKLAGHPSRRKADDAPAAP